MRLRKTRLGKPMSSKNKALFPLALAALGVVYGDIGTSPLYAFKEAMAGHHALSPSPEHVFAVLSALFWSITLIISIKYVLVVLEFDNEGEGGVLALTALAQRVARKAGGITTGVVLLGVFAAALFYGDAIITPAISVLSAVEGISVAAPELSEWVVPITVVILTLLFSIQRQGTSVVGKYFGPVTVVWFLTLAALGLASIAQTPEILGALDPRYALRFALNEPHPAFLMLSAVFLVLTGGEALYADMGHFGKVPVRLAWYGLVCPALVLNYFGQGALVLRDPSAVANPFYLLSPEWFLPILIGLATAATVIASQAVISGAFSITIQASRLGFLPRFRVLHTSDVEKGQIYIPAMNWMMWASVLLLVMEFGSSSKLANAYGIAVCAAMIIDSALCAFVVTHRTMRHRGLLLALLASFLALEGLFLAGNLSKFASGGWLPTAMGISLFILLTTWKRGSAMVAEQRHAIDIPMADFLAAPPPDVPRVAGNAVYLCSDLDLVPTALFHNLKHFKVLHERNIFLHIDTEEVPYVMAADRLKVRDAGNGMFVVSVRYGFRQEPDVPSALALPAAAHLDLNPMITSFFIARSQVVEGPGALPPWRRGLFAWMTRQSEGAAATFHLPPNQVVEVGTQVML
jgi:KUP system potassium uptake protein